MSKIVIVRSFLNPNDAYFAKSLLDDADIPSFIYDDNTSSMAYGYSQALGGVKLAVPEEFTQESINILDSEFEIIDNNAKLFGLLEERETCPKCRSNQIDQSRSYSIATILLALLVSLVLLHPRKIIKNKCRNCQHTWRSY